MEGVSLSDIAALNRDGDGWGGNGSWFVIVIILFALMGGKIGRAHV